MKYFFLLADVSGFTSFVDESEITHGKRIVGRLLNGIIHSVTLDLKVHEVEGDALFFAGVAPVADLPGIVNQIQKMHSAFREELASIQSAGECECGACSQRNALDVKFVAHEGEAESIRVGPFTKLYGREVIVVHRLLKNSVAASSYFLLTPGLVPPGFQTGMRRGFEVYPDLGQVDYLVLSLSRSTP